MAFRLDEVEERSDTTGGNVPVIKGSFMSITAYRFRACLASNASDGKARGRSVVPAKRV
jgi:hypothetical protein